MILKKKWISGAHLLLNCYLKRKTSRKLANGQNIGYSGTENGPRASSAPALGLNTIIFKYVYWYMKQISGERLQDHWSSGSSILESWKMERNRKMCMINMLKYSWSIKKQFIVHVYSF